MALLQISEPGQSPEPHQQRRGVGIDLGTTNTLVATVRSGSAEALPDSRGAVLLPSVVCYGEEGITVGGAAKALASSDPKNTIVSAKRFMGRGRESIDDSVYDFAEGEGMVRFATRSGNVSPVEASAEILKIVNRRAEQALDGPLDGAVLTVPAYFDDAQRQATKDAATLAGIKVLRLLSEPTAAAIAYGLDQNDSGLIAVYDLGGGTFDISILRLSRGVFEVLATGGDSALGGDDFDAAIVAWIRQEAGLTDTLSASQQRALLDIARDTKESLSEQNSVTVSFAGWQAEFDRAQLHSAVDALIDKTLRACKRALRDASVKASEVVDVVMVGGSTRMPRVREKVEQLFARPPLVSINPDTVVAIGAALQADVLVGNKPGDEMLLLDVIPLSLGLETMGGLVEKVIHRNTTIPVAKAQEFTTFKEGQTALAVHIVQGERELVSDCRSLARFELHDIPPMAAGAAKIRITFQVDADGLLNVAAEELNSGVQARIEVKPSYGLADDEISQMLLDSFAHAKGDMQARALREQQVEADRLIEDISAALIQDGAKLLDESALSCLTQAVDELGRVRESSKDHRELQRQIESVARLSEDFAARRMDLAIKGALSGHRLEEFEVDK
ncbi:MAG: Fe-S protein assembly chaperone HscA [Gammaproteobacteria bacterium]|nr:Fe-S protein assembly chaperone HscA [Gammaproteobacteria bacterium]MBQ0840494.1 Fe-S protein assembly chaperone HscA [Gammaproteobacteria bacterium]